MKTALVIGATGLVGTELIRLLLDDQRFDKVIVFGRNSLDIKNPKLVEYLINFEKPDSWHDFVEGDVLFSTLGTTLKKAGSKEAQYHIDHTYQYRFAKAAEKKGVKEYVLVSSASADPDTDNFYLKMKGELERDVNRLSFASIHILQPGLLAGIRKERRNAESAARIALKALNTVGLAQKYRPIPARTVAQAMINASMTAAEGTHRYTLEEVFRLGGYP